MQEENQLKLREEFILKKYDGDPPKAGEDKSPVETIRIVFIDNQIISKEVIKGAS